MNPFERSVYNLLDNERKDFIQGLPDMHKQAKKDAIQTIYKITKYMRHLMEEHSLEKERRINHDQRLHSRTRFQAQKTR